ncbi:hypothetical protein PMAYCL1PPCAC_27032 [Pristionchus mayeri]|uniref:MATH domain-containing protein n=1 Tax=Pristionchus mayeri TaxID=1317129 RepID=A0AAN5D6B5_9BILA|nr:hypothetical protein PMAYCL1PPCAC_27032 [Pristionchus mayeri]
MFTGISKLADKRVYSRTIKRDGIDWRVYTFRNNNNLALYLDGRDPTGSSFSACTQLQLISYADASFVHTKGDLSVPKMFTDKISRSGSKQFISFTDLYDEKKGFVKDDSILVAAVIKAYPGQ